MKKILFVAFLGTAFLFSNNSSAQYLMGGSKTDSTLPKIEFGVKLGANLQSISGETWDNTYKPGIVGGIFVGMHKNKIGVRAEVLASTSRFSAKTLTDSMGNKGDFRAIYLDIPILFEYSVTSRFAIQLGPQYSNMLSESSVGDFNGDIKTVFKQGEFSGVLGVEVKFPKHISAGLRYVLGFSSINNDAVSGYAETWKSSTAQLYVAYRIM